MKILVTGSAGHLGEALMRTFNANLPGYSAIGMDIKPSSFTDHVGSVCDRAFVSQCMQGVDAVLHTATLHKPHVGTHSRQDFVDTNITGTLNLLEEAVAKSVQSFVYTSTTSVFGDAMRSAPGAPAVWVTETLEPQAKNIYGVTKLAAENLCQLFYRNKKLPCMVLRTSRFFPEEDDLKAHRENYQDANLKVNELLFRRADIQDIVNAHLLAMNKAAELGFERLIISAKTPFQRSDCAELGHDAAAVVARYIPEYVAQYQKQNWAMFARIGRVYDSSLARQKLSWSPSYDFQYAISRLQKNVDYSSQLTQEIGVKRYHNTVFSDGPYPLDP